MTTEFQIEVLRSAEDLEACGELQKLTWGESFNAWVPPALLMVSQKIGGLVGGARAPDGDLAGFVYSLAGERDGHRAHWSHMLAVHPDYRGQGLGRQLKLFQRSELLSRGIGRVYWTFDPLVARNAHLNINRLGVDVVEYVLNLYGSSTGSPLHPGDTDRLVVRWDLDGPRVRWALDTEGGSARPPAQSDAPLISPDDDLRPGASTEDYPHHPSVRIEVPRSLESLAGGAPEVQRWRATVRGAFLHYLKRGYDVKSFGREVSTRTCYYLLRRH